MDEKKKREEEKYDEASAHFEAENMNKYDDLELKEKNLVIHEFEKEYVDPETGDVKNANQMLITEQLSRIVELQTDAIKGLHFDKVVVMGGGSNGGSVSSFVQDLVKNTIPLHEVGQSVGLELPGFLGNYKGDTAKPATTPAPDQKNA